jgi:pimeloyl-ACP methyl ester carboxylesterase
MKSKTFVTLCLWLAATSFAMAENPNSYKPQPGALAAMTNDAQVVFSQPRNFYYAFSPRNVTPQKGVIFYPGGLVDFRSYAPMARDIAAAGYLVVVVEMPLDIAFLGYDRATLIRLAYPKIKTWAVGGHSLGGVAASLYAYKNPNRLNGLFLWASYPADSNDLSKRKLKVISIYGSNDGLSTPEKVLGSVPLLPPATSFVEINGANHTQDGYYWDGSNPNFLQPGDNAAGITRDQQKAALTAAMVNFLQQL